MSALDAGGHYIAYCQNVINGQWYEFDDQYVTEVHETVVQNAEAYVLFYRCKKRKREKKVCPRLAACACIRIFTGLVFFLFPRSGRAARSR